MRCAQEIKNPDQSVMSPNSSANKDTSTYKMRRTGRKNAPKTDASTSYLATSQPTYEITYHIGTTAPRTEQRYVATGPPQVQAANFDTAPTPFAKDESLPFPDVTAAAEEAGATPAYETTAPCDEKGAKVRQTVAHMDELKAVEAVFLTTLLSLNHHSQLLTPCICGISSRVRKVGCSDCLQPQLLCRQCWLNKHRTMPTHWALVWNAGQKFFEKTDFSRVSTIPTSIALGHYGDRCLDAPRARAFTLVDSNGIHATAIAFCRCKTASKERTPEFQQLLRAGIFPGSVKEPKTGYTLGLLEFYRQERNQGKGSAYNFVHVLRRMADPYFEDSVPDIYANFLAITRFHQYLDVIMRRGHAHGIDDPLPGETDRPYPNRPIGFLGLPCAACPERGVNMPLHVNVPNYLRHLISQHLTLDGNFKANLFYKHDNGNDVALTDGKMYFPAQTEYDRLAEAFVVSEEDKEVPCHAHIGSIRHQGQAKYGNTAVSGVVACACDHTVVGSLIDMLKGEAFALGTYAHREHLRHTNSPPHGPSSATPTVLSYDSWCSFVVKRLTRAIEMFPEETWLHTLLAEVEGQIPADHINGHGLDCQTMWQAVYFACRAHFHGETAEMIWAFLNPLGSSTRQMTGPARHDTMNFVLDSWNTRKVLGQAQLLAAERLDALQLFEIHIAVVEDLSRQHATEVVEWSRHSRSVTRSQGEAPRSVYQHERTKVLTIEHILASMIAEEREQSMSRDEMQPRTAVAQWIYDGISIEDQQELIVALLKSHREHPLQETWATITKLRDTLNLDLNALDCDEPELTAIQLPSYRMKHGQRLATEADATDADLKLRHTETQLRCAEADRGILAVRAASLAVSAVRKARDDDYKKQAGITRLQRSVQKAELTKDVKIKTYNKARGALIYLGFMAQDAVEPYPPLTHRDTRRKETHLHRAKGDSRLFDGTAWYLQSGVTISRAAVTSKLSPIQGEHASDDEPQLLAGTQSLKCSGFKKSQRTPKRMKDIAPDDVVVEGASSASEAEESDLELFPSKGQKLGNDEKLAEYQKEMQWFRAEAEMFRWLEQYERKHAELLRAIRRYRRDGTVWAALADRDEKKSGLEGAVVYARKEAAMYQRLENNAKIIFKSADSGAHEDWVSATTQDELATKIDKWRDAIFNWMDYRLSPLGWYIVGAGSKYRLAPPGAVIGFCDVRRSSDEGRFLGLAPVSWDDATSWRHDAMAVRDDADATGGAAGD
ncbi:hypothetical protein GGX14DRAFT_561505 [Mycena pura]|uniref:CxC2-like cysteine cluster KDZ transposase-associated domain-containing protein n=1 Tax=Mycena pura TaxID=153505 RepID=A0AAD6VQ37_9AGAR|nr:hypothetical protein GGX14DRAFT_561505 [Mycena pura]